MTVQERDSDHCRWEGLSTRTGLVLDVRSDEFVTEARRQAQLVAAQDQSTDDQDFVEAIADAWGDE